MEIYKSIASSLCGPTSYNLRWSLVIFIPTARSTRSTISGTSSVHFRGSLILNKLSTSAKSSRKVSKFKNIKKMRNVQ